MPTGPTATTTTATLKQYIEIETTNSDYILLLMNIPGCPFPIFDLEVAAWNHNHATVVHGTLKNYFGLPSSANEGRIIFEFSTHNELVPVWPVDLGFGTNTNVRCNGWA